MQQDLPDSLPSVNNDTSKNYESNKIVNILKNITIVTSIMALCGIIFGIYCIVQIHQKENRISSLKAQIDNVSDEVTDQKPEEQRPKNNDKNMDVLNMIKNLHMIGDIFTKRRYYLGVTDLTPGQDTREKDTYIIDISKLGLEGGIKKYDLKTILNQVESDRAESLPDILAEGTTNAMPKSDCVSYKVEAGDPANSPSQVDWTIAADWGDVLPLTVYMACNMKNGGELSLGTRLYSLNPNTNELTQLTNEF